MSRTIVLFTDFGRGDEFVHAVERAIRSVLPLARIEHATHEIPPFDAYAGAAALLLSAGSLRGTVALAVVDPGVGSRRRPIALGCHTGTWLVGPDNGLLIPAARACGGIREAYEIVPALVALAGVSPTFHGRDLFAPAAAILAASDDGFLVGDPIEPEGLVPAPFEVDERFSVPVQTNVLGIDRFGNVRLCVRAKGIETRVGERFRVATARVTRDAVVSLTFSDVERGEIIIYPDSSGLLAIGVREGRADEVFGVGPSDAVSIEQPRRSL